MIIIKIRYKHTNKQLHEVEYAYKKIPKIPPLMNYKKHITFALLPPTCLHNSAVCSGYSKTLLLL